MKKKTKCKKNKKHTQQKTQCNIHAIIRDVQAKSESQKANETPLEAEI